MDLFPISTAMAAETAQAAPPSSMSSLLFMVTMLAVFYFLLIRPQMKRQKEHRTLIDGLAKGDEVVTNGGILGKVTRLEDSFLSLAIAEGVDIRVQRSAVAAVMPKGTFKLPKSD